MIHTFLTLLTARAIYLLPVLAAALLVGEPWARALQFPRLRAMLANTITALNRKLNRPQRSIAARLYRGMTALAMLLIPTAIAGLLLLRDAEWIRLLATLIMVALLGGSAGTWRIFRTWRQAKSGALTLQSDTWLFPDTHALLRYRIREAAESFSLVIGASFYFLLADMPGLLLYLMLAAAAHSYTPQVESNRAFGWSAAGLFALFNFPVRILAGILLWLAALFTPRTRPVTALRHLGTRFDGWVAWLTGLSLGGLIPGPAGELKLPWIGGGTPKPAATDYGRTIQLTLIGWIIFICLLGSSIYVLNFNK